MPSNVNVTTTIRDKDYSAVRFGMPFDYEELRFIADRDPYGRKLVSGFVEDALGGRFDLMKADTPDEPVDNNDEIWKEIKKDWKNFKKGIKIQRTWGEAFTCIFTSKNPTRDSAPFLKVFEPKEIDDDEFQLYNDGSIKQLFINEEEHLTGKIIPHKFTTKEQLEKVWHNIQETKEQMWDGRSYLEPVWDEIQGIRAIRMGCVLYAIRLGAGMRIIILPEGTDADVVDDMKAAAKKWESFNGFFVIPEGDARVEIETGQGQVNYEALKLVLLQAIAAYTGYPIVGFQGLEMERQAGDFQEEKVLDVSRVIQNDVEDQLRWFLTQYDRYYKWNLDNKPPTPIEDSQKTGVIDKVKAVVGKVKDKVVKPKEGYIIKWRGKEEISEGAQANLDAILIQNDAALITAGIESADEVRKRRGLKGPAPERPDQFGISVKGLGKEEEKEQPETEDDDKE